MMRPVSLLLIVFMFASWGCAHQKSQTVSVAQPGRALQQDREIPASADLKHGPAPGNEEDFFEQDLETLYEEATSGALLAPDPIEGLNRVMFQFNDKLYFWFLKPVAQTYRLLMPEPVRLANALLQGKINRAGAELTRFLMNSTLGLLGFGDPAKKYPELASSAEDLGQTLGAYGIDSGFYIVWPFLGPSTLRDSVGFLGDRFLNPTTYVQPPEASWGLQGYHVVNTASFRIGDYETLKNASLDPYAALRDAYFQNRNKAINE